MLMWPCLFGACTWSPILALLLCPAGGLWPTEACPMALPKLLLCICFYVAAFPCVLRKHLIFPCEGDQAPTERGSPAVDGPGGSLCLGEV